MEGLCQFSFEIEVPIQNFILLVRLFSERDAYSRVRNLFIEHFHVRCNEYSVFLHSSVEYLERVFAVMIIYYISSILPHNLMNHKQVLITHETLRLHISSHIRNKDLCPTLRTIARPFLVKPLLASRSIKLSLRLVCYVTICKVIILLSFHCCLIQSNREVLDWNAYCLTSLTKFLNDIYKDVCVKCPVMFL